MSPGNLRKVAHPDLVIYINIILIGKSGNEKTEGHTRNRKVYGGSVKHLKNFSRRFEKESSSGT